MLHEAREEHQFEKVGQQSEHTVTGFPKVLMPDRYVSPVRCEGASECGEPAVPGNIEDEIVADAPSSEVLPGVINYFIRPE